LAKVQIVTPVDLIYNGFSFESQLEEVWLEENAKAKNLQTQILEVRTYFGAKQEVDSLSSLILKQS